MREEIVRFTVYLGILGGLAYIVEVVGDILMSIVSVGV